MVLALSVIVAGAVPTAADAPEAGRIVVVAGNRTPPVPDRQFLEVWEGAGYRVDVVDDDELPSDAEFESADLVWISATVRPAAIGSRLAELRVPIGTHEALLYDEMGLATRSGFQGELRDLRLTEGSEIVRVNTRLRSMAWGRPGADAVVRATLTADDSKAVVFHYAPGDALVDGRSAVSCRGAFFAGWDNPNFNARGRQELASLTETLATCRVTPNTAPVIEEVPDRLDTEGDTVGFVVRATDADEHALSYEADGLPAGVAIDEASGAVVGEIGHAAARTEPYQVRVTVSDGRASASVDFEWQVVTGPNQPPTIAPPDDRVDQVGAHVALSIDASDPDDDALDVSVAGLPPGLTYDPDTASVSGVVTDAAIGAHRPIVTVSDGTETASVEFVWSVTAASSSVLLVSAHTGPPSVDRPLVARLVDNGFEVTIVDDNALPSPSVIEQHDLVWISTTVSPSRVGDHFTNVATPVGLHEANLFDDLGLGTTSGHQAGQTQVDDPIDGTVTTSSSRTAYSWATVGEDADTLAHISGRPDRSAVFRYSADAVLANGSDSPGCRAGFFSGYGTPRHLTDAGWTYFDQLVDWLSSCSAVGEAPDVVEIAALVDRVDPPGADVSLLPEITSTSAYSVDALGLPAGIEVDHATGLMSGTLATAAHRPEPYSVVVTVRSDSGAEATTSFEWAVNTAPEIAPVADRRDEAPGAVVVPVVVNDPDGDVLAVSATGLPVGATIDVEAGAIVGDLPSSASSVEPYRVTVVVDDGHGATTSTSFDWTIDRGVNAAPIIDPVQGRFDSEHDVVVIMLAASDADDDRLRFSADGLPAGIEVDPDSGRVAGTIAVGATAGDPVVITVSDDFGGTSSTTFRWDINPSPVFDVGPLDQRSRVGDTVSFDVVATDPDGDPVSYTATGLPPGIEVDAATGRVSGTVEEGDSRPPVSSYAVIATDLDGGRTSMSATWIVNADPFIEAVADRTDREAAPVDGVVSATDPNGDSLTFSASGLPSGITIDPQSGAFVGAAAIGTSDVTPSGVTVTVSDAFGGTATTTFEWSIDPVLVADYIHEVGQSGPATRLSSFSKPCVVDIDGDGLLDTIWSQHKSALWDVYMAESGGTYRPDTDTWVQHDNHGCIAADFDNDGDVDLLAPQGACEGTCLKRDRLYLQQPDGSFKRKDWKLGARTLDRSRNSVVVDHDNDGWLDVYITASGSPTGSQHRLMRNRGLDSSNRWLGFEELAVGVERASGNAECADAADFDGDGYDELLVCQFDGFFVYRRDATGIYTEYPSNMNTGNVMGAESRDLDGDGWIDLIVVRTSVVEIRLNDRGDLNTIHAEFPVLDGYEAVTPDIDGDGDPDIVIVQAHSGFAPGDLGAHQLWINETADARSWRRVELPQPARGAGDKAEVYPDFRGSGRDAVLIGNGGRWDTKGPRQWLAIAEL